MLIALFALQASLPPVPTCDVGWQRIATSRDSAAGRVPLRAELREAARAAPRDGERWLAYGLFMTLTATEETGEWRQRVEAEQALERAFRLLPGDPRPMAALAVLKRKQGARVDARRMVRRALNMAARGDGDLDSCYEAELYYQMALVHRTSWEDWEGMTFMGGPAEPLTPCARRDPPYPGAPEELACPSRFYQSLSLRTDMTPMRHDDRDAVIEYLRTALEANPSHRAARRALLLALFELQDWDAFDHVVHDGVAADARDAWIPLWGATGAYERRDMAASERFARGALRLLPPAEREVLLSPARIVTPQVAERWDAAHDSTYWRAADPLFLTELNERLLGHMARVTYAAAKFDVPLLATIGPDTDAGNVLVRYGRPWRRWMRHALTDIGADGRELIWAMDSTSPPLKLSRALTMRRWRFREESEHAVSVYARDVPQRWDAGEAFEFFDSLPVLAARFEEDGHIVLDAYALWRNPYDDLVPDTVRIAFFVHDGAMNRLLDRQRTVIHRTQPLTLMFRAPLAEGLYWYSVESLAGPGRAAGRARGGLRVAAPDPDSLRVSDLLLGRRMRAPEPVIRHRDALRIEPLYDLELTPGDSLVAYWETYGLRPDSVGTVRYQVVLDVREADRGAMGDVVAWLGGVLGLGRRDGFTLEWEVEAPAGEGAQRDVVVIDPGAWPAGAYTLRVRIEEPATGRQAVTERRLQVAEPAPGPQ
ncbi:MAG TPA: hypothetical protein VGA20_11955 [Gemmatimonadales bacterium]